MEMSLQTGTRPRGHPPRNWQQFGVKAPPALLAEIDAWRLAQLSAPCRPTAIRRLLAATLLEQAPPPASNAQSPFANGDRVHSINEGAACFADRRARRRLLRCLPICLKEVRKSGS
jgi:hypothetical protein